MRLRSTAPGQRKSSVPQPLKNIIPLAQLKHSITCLSSRHLSLQGNRSGNTCHLQTVPELSRPCRPVQVTVAGQSPLLLHARKNQEDRALKIDPANQFSEGPGWALAKRKPPCPGSFYQPQTIAMILPLPLSQNKQKSIRMDQQPGHTLAGRWNTHSLHSSAAGNAVRIKHSCTSPGRYQLSKSQGIKMGFCLLSCLISLLRTSPPSISQPNLRPWFFRQRCFALLPQTCPGVRTDGAGCSANGQGLVLADYKRLRTDK